MKKLFLLVPFFFLVFCQHEPQFYKAEPLETNKKKVIVLYNRSGGGHVAAAQVVREALGDDYAFININFSDTYLDRGSFFSWISNGKFGSDFWYNYTLKKGSISLSNFFAKNLVPGIVKRKKTIITKNLSRDFSIVKPDLVISTIPIVNGFVGNVSKEKKIPFVVTTQDGDLRYFTPGLKEFSYDKFFMTVGINGDRAKKQMLESGIPENQVHKLYHPVRKSFLETQNRSIERKKLSIPNNAFTIMILLGAAGSDKIIRYTNTLLKKHPNIYVIACVGRSEVLKQKLQDLSQKERLRVIGFTKEIPQIMTASDLLLTKPGPNSIIEALYMNLPMLVDHSSTILVHEKENLDFVTRNHYGRKFTKIKELNQFVSELKDKGTQYQKLKSSVLSYKKGDYRIQFKKLVEEILKENDQNKGI